jgi:hypothetical protein
MIYKNLYHNTLYIIYLNTIDTGSCASTNYNVPENSTKNIFFVPPKPATGQAINSILNRCDIPAPQALKNKPPWCPANHPCLGLGHLYLAIDTL